MERIDAYAHQFPKVQFLCYPVFDLYTASANEIKQCTQAIPQLQGQKKNPSSDIWLPSSIYSF